jgi:hypothetical protein
MPVPVVEPHNGTLRVRAPGGELDHYCPHRARRQADRLGLLLDRAASEGHDSVDLSAVGLTGIPGGRVSLEEGWQLYEALTRESARLSAEAARVARLSAANGEGAPVDAIRKEAAS